MAELLDNGWVLLPVTPAMIAAARQRHAEMMDEAATRPVKVRAVADPERRSWGVVAEFALRRWLTEQGTHVIAYGGVDGRPDLEVNGVSVGVKFARYRGMYRMSNNVHVFDAHRGSALQWAFHGNAGDRTDAILLLGFASCDQIAAGRPAAAGVPQPSGFVPAEDMHELYVSELMPPTEWCRVLSP
jgi:hypothetical protein